MKLTEANTALMTPAGTWTLEIVVELADTHEYVAARQPIQSLYRQTPAIV